MSEFRFGWVLAVLIFCSMGRSAIVHVVPPGTPGVTPTSPYDSWDIAATSIATAISYSSAGDTVLVSNGTYVLSSSLSVGKGITLKSLNGAAVTTLDGNEATQILTLSHLDAVADGFTITRAHYTGDGGGVRILSGGGTLRNCIVSNNWAGTGGGVQLSQTGKARVIDCTIVANRASLGGGVRIRNDGGDYALLGCTIATNTATNVGGIYNQADCMVSNCTLLDNIATNGYIGGGMLGIYIDCRIVGNRALGTYGGGLSNPQRAERCLIASNTAATTGGGIFLSGTRVVSNCVISANQAGSNGGGIYFADGGAVYDSQLHGNIAAANGGGIHASRSGKMQNCLLYDNRAQGSGGGAYLDRLTYLGGFMASCTVAGNQATNSGGGLYLSTTLNANAVTNTIVAYNQAGGTYPNILASSDSTKAFWHCCCPDYASFEPGQGNLQTDPLFVDAPNADYRLKRASPCIDAGTNQPWMAGATDLDGNARIDSPDDLGLVDIGCFEYKPLRGALLLLR